MKCLELTRRCINRWIGGTAPTISGTTTGPNGGVSGTADAVGGTGTTGVGATPGTVILTKAVTPAGVFGVTAPSVGTP